MTPSKTLASILSRCASFEDCKDVWTSKSDRSQSGLRGWMHGLCGLRCTDCVEWIEDCMDGMDCVDCMHVHTEITYKILDCTDRTLCVTILECQTS